MGVMGGNGVMNILKTRKYTSPPSPPTHTHAATTTTIINTAAATVTAAAATTTTIIITRLALQKRKPAMEMSPCFML